MVSPDCVRAIARLSRVIYGVTALRGVTAFTSAQLAVSIHAQLAASFSSQGAVSTHTQLAATSSAKLAASISAQLAGSLGG